MGWTISTTLGALAGGVIFAATVNFAGCAVPLLTLAIHGIAGGTIGGTLWHMAVEKA